MYIHHLQIHRYSQTCIYVHIYECIYTHAKLVHTYQNRQFLGRAYVVFRARDEIDAAIREDRAAVLAVCRGGRAHVDGPWV